MSDFDTRDKATAEAFEAAVKDAHTNGIPSFTSPIMTDEQYAPEDDENVAPTLPRDANRGMGAAVAASLRAAPFRLVEYSVTTLPPPSAHRGAIAYCHNGASGAAVVVFCDGTNWRRLDTLATV